MKAEALGKGTSWSEQWTLGKSNKTQTSVVEKEKTSPNLQDALEAGYENLKDDPEAQRVFFKAIENLEENETVEEFIFFLKISPLRYVFWEPRTAFWGRTWHK